MRLIKCTLYLMCAGAVTADDPEALANCCIELLQDSAKRTAMAQALQQAVPINAAAQIYESLKEHKS